MQDNAVRGGKSPSPLAGVRNEDDIRKTKTGSSPFRAISERIRVLRDLFDKYTSLVLFERMVGSEGFGLQTGVDGLTETTVPNKAYISIRWA